MTTPPSTAEQIEILLTGRAFEFAKAHTGKSKLTDAEYASLFNVSHEQVLNHVRVHGLPAGAWSSRPSGSDGVYMIEHEGSYLVCIQERGVAFSESSHNSKAEAEVATAKLLMGVSGTGLYTASFTPPRVHWWSHFIPKFLRSLE